MIYVKFNENNISVTETNLKPLDDDSYIELSDNLSGKTLIKEGNTARPLTDKELEEFLLFERDNLFRKQARYLADLKLKQSEYLIFPDAWESYNKTQKTRVKAYRDFLKKIEEQEGFPLELKWLDPPEFKG